MAAGLEIPLLNGAVLSLPRGFKFTPSDEDLVLQYLRRRAVGEPLPCAVVADVDLSRHSPWALVTRGTKEKYFMARVALRFEDGRRADISAGEGCWRATGEETPVHARADLALVGVKSEMVFYRRYRGGPPAGQRTRWVMDEYRLAGAGLMSYTIILTSPGAGGSGGCAPQCSRCGTAVGPIFAMDTKNEDLPGARSSIVSLTVNPDASWIVCRIYKKRRMPRVEAANANGGGPANSGSSPTTSCITDTSKEEEEVSNVGADKEVSTNNDN